jgi:glycosyltransferase involved in cell wall biosynthesis
LRKLLKTRLNRYRHEPKELIWNARYVPKEMRLLRAEKPDLLLVRSHFMTASCVPVATQLRLPLVLEVNAPPLESRMYFDQYRHLPLVAEWLEALKLRAADAVTTVSTPLKNHLVNRYGLNPQKVHVVPNGADTNVFRPSTDPGVARSEAPTIGFVGSFEKWHGIDRFADMVDALEKTLPMAC